MKKFKYKGYDENSVAQVGTLEAENYADAYAVLQYQGVKVVSLEQERISLVKLLEDFFLKYKLGGRWELSKRQKFYEKV